MPKGQGKNELEVNLSVEVMRSMLAADLRFYIDSQRSERTGPEVLEPILAVPRSPFRTAPAPSRSLWRWPGLFGMSGTAE